MDERLILVGDLARRCGVTPRTLRVYERRGLIAPVERGPNGYRLFDPSIESTILIFGTMLSLGLSLSEIADVFAESRPIRHAQTPADTRAGMVRAKATYERHIAAVDAERDRLLHIREALVERVHNCSRELGRTGPTSLDGLRQPHRRSRPGRIEYVR
jgi:DNA-binding transcriptional MerR regulator